MFSGNFNVVNQSCNLPRQLGVDDVHGTEDDELPDLPGHVLGEDGAPDGGAPHLVLQGQLHHEGLPLALGGLQGDVPGPGGGEAKQPDLEDSSSAPGHHRGGSAVAAYQTSDLLTVTGQDSAKRYSLVIE